MTLAISTTMRIPFDEAVRRTREALAEQGFGVLTEIDVKATLKEKLDRDVEGYLILGACNPRLAHQALGVDRQIGLLLPCNVVVRTDPDSAGVVIVDAMDPQIMVQVAVEADLQPVADSAAAKLRAVIETLATISEFSR